MLVSLPNVLIEVIIHHAASKHEGLAVTADIHRVMRVCRLLKDTAMRASLHEKICILGKCSNAALELCLQLAAGRCTHFVANNVRDVTADALALLKEQNGIEHLCLSGCSKILLSKVLPWVPAARILDVWGTDMHQDESAEQLTLMDELGRREAAGCIVDVMWCPVDGRGGHVAAKRQVSECVSCGSVGCDECTHLICAECNKRCGCCESCASDDGRCSMAWKPWAPDEECLNFLCDECIRQRGTKCDDCERTMCSTCIAERVRAGVLTPLECEDSEFNMSRHTFNSWLRCHPNV